MLIPSQAISLLWTLRAQGAPDKQIRAVLAKPLTERPVISPFQGWFYAWKKKHEEVVS
jgi:hypothetical protein